MGRIINSDRVIINVLSYPDDVIYNFHKKIEISLITGCWNWTGCKNRQGYGQLGKSPRIAGGVKALRAHQLSWIIYFGEIPSGMWILHKCDNPSCVNPNHLFLGTHQDNISDMVFKGRHSYPVGEDSHLSKLTKDDVIKIKQLIKSGKSQASIAKEFKVSKSAVKHISRERSWSWIK
jgi:hypothetical protein